MVDVTALFNRRRWPIVVVVLVLLLALALEGGFYLGQRSAYHGLGAKPKAYSEMQAELVALQNRLRSRDAEMAIQATRNEVDRHALELVRRELAEQKEEIAGLVSTLR